MKPKTLAILAGVMVVLGGLVFLKRSGDEPLGITKEVELRHMLPEDLSSSDVAKLTMYAGAKPEEKLVLAKQGDTWIVESHFNAPVLQTKIDEYLKKLVNMKGEFRAAAKDDAGLKDYELANDRAFHIEGRGKEGDAPLFHVLVGESPKYGNMFMRADGSLDIFVGDANLRQEAGLNSEEMGDAPEPATWLDKAMLKIDKEDIKRIALTLPDKDITLEYREKPSEEPAPAEAPADGATPPPPAPEMPKEYEWKLAGGGYGTTFKQQGVDSLVSKLIALNATDIVDPAKKAEYGLDAPKYVARVTRTKDDGTDEEIVIEGGRPDAAGDGYLRLSSSDKDIVYKTNRYGFEQLFPKGSQLFDLPKLTVPAADVTAIDYKAPSGHVVLTKDGENWKVQEPASPLPMIESKPTSIASALASWHADDYSTPGAATGLDAPTHSVTFKTKDGASHTIDIGAKAVHTDGFYARLDGGAEVLVAAKTDIDKIFAAPKDLYERGLLDIAEDEIKRIDISRDGQSFALERAAESWEVVEGDARTAADQTKAEDLTFDLNDLEGDDLIFGDGYVLGGIVGTIKLTMADGVEHTLSIDTERDGHYPVKVDAISSAFLVKKEDLEKVLVAPAALKPAPPAQEKPAEAQPTEETPAITVTPAPPALTIDAPAATPPKP